MDILINLYITWAHTKGRGFLGDNTENQHEIDLGKQKFASFLMRNKEKKISPRFFCLIHLRFFHAIYSIIRMLHLGYTDLENLIKERIAYIILKKVCLYSIL